VSATRDVDHQQGQLQRDGETDGLGLQGHTRAARRRHRQRTAESRPQCRADARDLVLGLEGPYAEVLVLAQLVQDVRGRGDRVGAQEQREVGLARGRDQAVRQGQVPGDVPVRTDREGLHRRGHLVADREVLGGLAEVPAGAEGGDVGGRDVGLPGELRLQELLGALGRPVVHPAEQPQREHVLAALGLFPGEVERLQRLDRQARQRHRVEAVAVERAVLEGRGVVPHLLHRPLGELVRVDDDLRAAWHVADVRLQGGRVHRHEHVRRVTGREDVVVGEVQLEGRDPGKGAGGGADLGGEVRQGGQVVAEGRGLGGEAVTGELHTVTRVPREPDDHPVEAADALRTCRFALLSYDGSVGLLRWAADLTGH
jgi:hypothetical protein